MDTKLTKEQKAARVAILLSLREPLTDGELDLIQGPSSQWTQAMRDKIGPLVRLAEAEDARAENPPPENAPSQEP